MKSKESKKPASSSNSSQFPSFQSEQSQPVFSSPPAAKEKIIQSCQSRIGRDIFDQSGKLQVQPRGARSYQSRSSDEEDESDRQHITEQQKQQKKDELVEGYVYTKEAVKRENKEKAKPKVQQKIKSKNQFTEEILESEEISVADSFSNNTREKKNQNSEAKMKQNIEAREPKEKAVEYFNVMLVGAQSTGKTTYLECMSRKYKQQKVEKSEIIKTHTEQFMEIVMPPSKQELSLDFRIVDTPGFTHSSIEEYATSIKGEIWKRSKQYDDLLRKSMTESAVYSSKERNIVDCRIHCCLFFFRGPRIHEDDWILQRQLHSICNIIPVICKGDSYSIQELEALKKAICHRRGLENVTWFDVEEFMRQKHGGVELLKGPYGQFPPFMIACSTTRIEAKRELQIAREFRWGTCIVENPEHTEFQQLKEMLLKYLRKGLVKMTDVKWQRQSEAIRLEQKNSKNDKLLRYFSVAFTIISIGTAFIFKDKLMPIKEIKVPNQ